MPTPDFAEVYGRESLMKGVYDIGFPCVFKTRKRGYDGHGQAFIREPEDLRTCDRYFGSPAILEQFIEFDYDASIVMVRDGKRRINFPIGRNIHGDGILDLFIDPAPPVTGTSGRTFGG